MIRELVVDDHSVVRAGVRLLLDNEDDMEAVGEAADAREALEMAGKLTPDVVLMDVGLPGRRASTRRPRSAPSCPTCAS